MKQIVKSITLAGLLGFSSYSAQAALVTFDQGFPEQTAATINFGDFSVSAGYSGSFNLAPTVTQSFSRAIINSASVILDANPADGGLGVISNIPNSSDNFEGSLGNVNNDEILFFDFSTYVTIEQILLNAGVGSGHQDLFPSSASDVFGVFTSLDGINYSSITAGNIGITAGEILDITATGAQYLAVAHVGPTSSVGGYIESIEYSEVPVPATLALFGIGLLGLGHFSRKQQ